jgi:hypothetical protein
MNKRPADRFFRQRRTPQDFAARAEHKPGNVSDYRKTVNLTGRTVS